MNNISNIACMCVSELNHFDFRFNNVFFTSTASFELCRMRMNETNDPNYAHALYV